MPLSCNRSIEACSRIRPHPCPCRSGCTAIPTIQPTWGSSPRALTEWAQIPCPSSTRSQSVPDGSKMTSRALRVSLFAPKAVASSLAIAARSRFNTPRRLGEYPGPTYPPFDVSEPCGRVGTCCLKGGNTVENKSAPAHLGSLARIRARDGQPRRVDPGRTRSLEQHQRRRTEPGAAVPRHPERQL